MGERERTNLNGARLKSKVQDIMRDMDLIDRKGRAEWLWFRLSKLIDVEVDRIVNQREGAADA